MAAGGVSSNIELGAGRLYYAPLGTAEPVSCSAVLPSAWQVVGYTETGSDVSFQYTVSDINVAEELYPVLVTPTTATGVVKFDMAEPTRRRLALAFGAGAGYLDDAESFEPPALGAQVAVMMVWDSLDVPSALNVRWVFRQLYPAGTIDIKNQKAPNKKLVPVEMRMIKPNAAQPFIVFPNSAGLI